MKLCHQSNVTKVISLLFNMLSRLVIAFLPRSKHLLISWLQSPSVVILEPKKIKSVTVSIVSPSTSHEVVGLDAMILIFWILRFKPAFSLSSFTFIKGLFNSSLLSAIRVVLSAALVCWLGAGYPGWTALAYGRLSKGPIPYPGWLSVRITQWPPVGSSWISFPATASSLLPGNEAILGNDFIQLFIQLVLHLAWRFAWCTLHIS